MALPVVQYDVTNGSNTAASGAGPATAVTGTGAVSGDGAGGGTQTVIDLSADSPDLSGVASDGSAVLWLDNTSGERHLFKITAVDDGADTVTVEFAPTTAINSGVNWAIGGERAGLINDTTWGDWRDWGSGWIAEFDAGTYQNEGNEIDNLNGSSSAPVILRAKSGAASMPIINNDSDVNARLINLTAQGSEAIDANVQVQNLHLRNEGTNTASAVVRINSVCDRFTFYGCKVEQSASSSGAAALHLVTTVEVDAFGCEFVSGDELCIWWSNARVNANFTRCWIHTTATSGSQPMVDISGTNLAAWVFNECVFSGASAHAINVDVGDIMVTVNRCTFYDIGTDGVQVDSGAAATHKTVVTNSLFQDCGGYGINAVAENDVTSINNAFRSCTSGNHNNVSDAIGEIALTVDALTDPANDDFTINNTAGGGAECRNLSWDLLNADTTGYDDIGAAGVEAAAGGGGASSYAF